MPEGIALPFAARDGECRYFDAQGLDELVSRGSITPGVSPTLSGSTRARARSAVAVARGCGRDRLALLELPAGLSETQLAGRALLPDAIPLIPRLEAAFSQRVQRLPRTPRGRRCCSPPRRQTKGAIVCARRPLGLASESLDAAEPGRPQRRQCGAARPPGTPSLRSAGYESATLAERRRAHAALAESLSEPEHADRRGRHRGWRPPVPDEGSPPTRGIRRALGVYVGKIGGDRIRACRQRKRDRSGAWQAARRPAGTPSRGTTGSRRRAPGAGSRTCQSCGSRRRWTLSVIIESFTGSLAEAVTTPAGRDRRQRRPVVSLPQDPPTGLADRVPAHDGERRMNWRGPPVPAGHRGPAPS